MHRCLRGFRGYASVPDSVMQESINAFFTGNQQWLQTTQKEDISKMAAGQSPDLLWIGCSDSRAAASVVTRSSPGRIFATRNIANTVVHSDMSMLSVVQYAVEVLKVKHVAVVGHTKCGGIKAALDGKPLGLIDNWLRHIQDTCEVNAKELASIKDYEERTERLADLHIMAGVEAVGRIHSVQQTWAQGHSLWIHGWKFDVGTGKIRDLNCSLKSAADLHGAFQLPNIKH